MSSEWYYAKGNEKHGPFSTAEIKRLASVGQLAKHDLVWKAGAADWVRASKVKGLFPEEAPEPSQPPKAAEPEAKDAAAGEVTTAALALLSALTRRAKQATHKALESASQHRSKARADAPRDQVNRPSQAHRTKPRIPGKKRRSLLTLLLVGGVLWAFSIGLVVSGVISPAYLYDYIQRQAATDGKPDTFLRSFDQHPPPIHESIKNGKRVWLLDDFRSENTTGKHKSHKQALYAVFNDGELEYIVLKTHHDPIASKEMYQRNREVDTWEQMPAGESQPFKGLERSIQGKEESPEHATVELEQTYNNADNPDSILTNVTQVYTDIRYNEGSTKAGWGSKVYSSSSVKTRGKTLRRQTNESYEGLGNLLR